MSEQLGNAKALPNRRGFLELSAVSGIAAVLCACNKSSAEDPKPMNPRFYTFVGGNTGLWTVTKVKTVSGEPILEPKKIDVLNKPVSALPDGALWQLRGVTSNVRYVDRAEKRELESKQAALGRPEATHGALIPIRKTAEWWGLTQDERRAIFEESSHHTAVGLKYLPSIARRLHHCRDLEGKEPFDFLTLFDYAKADSAAFDDLVETLRETEEWKYVDREIDIRMVRE